MTSTLQSLSLSESASMGSSKEVPTEFFTEPAEDSRGPKALMGKVPSVCEHVIFSRQVSLGSPPFIRPMHPKTEIRPIAHSIRKILEAGWVGQLKIHGHRAQIHLPADASQEIVVYNRQGQIHAREIPQEMAQELRRFFAPHMGWNVIDAEWIKSEGKLYVFDYLKKDDEVLWRLPFLERWKMLPRAFIIPSLQTLGILTSMDQCLEALSQPNPRVEGLVFKSRSPGFEDTSIIRCRK